MSQSRDLEVMHTLWTTFFPYHHRIAHSRSEESSRCYPQNESHQYFTFTILSANHRDISLLRCVLYAFSARDCQRFLHPRRNFIVRDRQSIFFIIAYFTHHRLLFHFFTRAGNSRRARSGNFSNLKAAPYHLCDDDKLLMEFESILDKKNIYMWRVPTSLGLRQCTHPTLRTFQSAIVRESGDSIASSRLNYSSESNFVDERQKGAVVQTGSKRDSHTTRRKPFSFDVFITDNMRLKSMKSSNPFLAKLTLDQLERGGRIKNQYETSRTHEKFQSIISQVSST